MKSTLISLSLSVCVGFLPASAFADTLQFVNSPGPVVSNEHIFPYNFHINGSSALTSMICLNFNREITDGETWNAKASSIALDNSTLSIEYRALALIDYGISTGYGGYSTADYQFADWDIFDPKDVDSNSGYTATAASIKNYALSEAQDASLISSGFFSAFTLYQPTSDSTGWTKGIPQEFLRYNGTPGTTGGLTATPEPSGLMLLGTGLLSVGGMMRRRMKKS